MSYNENTFRFCHVLYTPKLIRVNNANTNIERPYSSKWHIKYLDMLSLITTVRLDECLTYIIWVLLDLISILDSNKIKSQLTVIVGYCFKPSWESLE